MQSIDDKNCEGNLNFWMNVAETWQLSANDKIQEQKGKIKRKKWSMLWKYESGNTMAILIYLNGPGCKVTSVKIKIDRNIKTWDIGGQGKKGAYSIQAMR